jgi:hypothetical protein
MSCRNFETVIIEIARGQMLEAAAREDTLEHIKACQPCASRLANEQALTAGLRNVVSIEASRNASASVESKLVSAFRQRSAVPASPLAGPATRTLSRWATVGIAAAATILVISAFAVSRLLFIDSPASARGGAQIEQPSTPSAPTVTAKEPAQSPVETVTLPSPPDVESKLATLPVSPRAFERPRGLIKNADFNNRPIHSANNYENVAHEEITTEFMPLTYGGLSQVDDGQVVRVEVSRTALQSFGLPVNIERAGERVKADVLLGHDGVARAIRFVR